MTTVEASNPDLLQSPNYCPYNGGRCEYSFIRPQKRRCFFIYSSEPTQIAEAIENAARSLQSKTPQMEWKTWRSLPIHGKIVFCEICNAVRTSDVVVADVTTLNFNVLFEIGLCIGLGVPIIPIRDASYEKHKREFAELGVLDTLGYVDFRNSAELADRLAGAMDTKAMPPPHYELSQESPLYLAKGPVETEGALQLLATVKKSALRFRAYDQDEKQRLSLHEARKQVLMSLGVIAHLLSPNRTGAMSHNALCAFLGGLALSHQKILVMLQEEHVSQPIDYRDLVLTYSSPARVAGLLDEPMLRVIARLQEGRKKHAPLVPRQLEGLDLGDTAAENEIAGLRAYFVQTGQFQQARKGNARLIVGRKGSGKTATFYGLRDSIGRGPSKVVLDLKPEGHQFKKLREVVLLRLSEGLQEHTMTAFWSYILLCEFARKVLKDDAKYAERRPERYEQYVGLQDAYRQHDAGPDSDFSQRLLWQIARLCDRVGAISDHAHSGNITSLVFSGDIHELTNALAGYIKEKDEAWLLVDNLDKGWPTRTVGAEEILILRSFMDATRKIQREFEKLNIAFRCLVFVRTDIYENLLHHTSDKGKDTVIRLDGNDREMFQELVRARLCASLERVCSFAEAWSEYFVSHVGSEDSFGYILRRTLMRPRDLLVFLQACVAVALNRGHAIVEESDIRQAEKSHSEDMVILTGYEIADSFPKYGELIYALGSKPRVMRLDEFKTELYCSGVSEEDLSEALEILLWYGVVGVRDLPSGEEHYCYDVSHNVRHLVQRLRTEHASVVVHPAFCVALGAKGG